MAANTPSVAKSTAQTQAGSFVDVVTFSYVGDLLWCDNRSSTVNIWITYSRNSDPAATPSAGADGALYVPAGSFRSWPVGKVVSVKLFGDAVAMSYAIGVL
jgi:hypothetical protein